MAVSTFCRFLPTAASEAGAPGFSGESDLWCPRVTGKPRLSSRINKICIYCQLFPVAAAGWCLGSRLVMNPAGGELPSCLLRQLAVHL